MTKRRCLFFVQNICSSELDVFLLFIVLTNQFQIFRYFNQSRSTRYNRSVAEYSSRSMVGMSISIFHTVQSDFFNAHLIFMATIFRTLTIEVVHFFCPLFHLTIMHFCSSTFFSFSNFSPYLFLKVYLSSFLHCSVRFFEIVFPFPICPCWISQFQSWFELWETSWGARLESRGCRLAVHEREWERK